MIFLAIEVMSPPPAQLAPDRVQQTTSTVTTIRVVGDQLGSVVGRNFDSVMSQYFAEHFGDGGKQYLSGIDGNAISSFRDIHKSIAEKIGQKMLNIIRLIGSGDSVMYWNGSPRASSDTTGGKIFDQFHQIIAIIELISVAKNSNELSHSGAFIDRLLSIEPKSEWIKTITDLKASWKETVTGQTYSSDDAVEWQFLALKIIARAHWTSLDHALLLSILSDNNFVRIRKFCSKEYLLNPESCESLKGILISMIAEIDNATIMAMRNESVTTVDYTGIFTEAKSRLDFLFNSTGEPDQLQTDLKSFVGLMLKLGYSQAGNKGIDPITSTSTCTISKIPLKIMDDLRSSLRLGSSRAGFEKIMREYPSKIGEDLNVFCSATYSLATTEGILGAIKRAVLCYNSQTEVKEETKIQKCNALDNYFIPHLSSLAR